MRLAKYSLLPRTLFFSLLATAAWASGAAAQPKNNEKDPLAEFYGSKASQTAAVDKVLANTNRSDALTMLVAAGTAYKLHRLEDAGFLYYAGNIRGKYDLKRFPPIGKNSDGPSAALGASAYVVGETVNPAITDVPNTYIAVVNRLAAWDCRTTSGYQMLLWQYKSGSLSETQSCTDIQNSYVKPMRGIATLFGIPEYFSAFKAVKALNQSSQNFIGGLPSAAQQQSYDAANATMRRIENEQHIKGFASSQNGS